MKQQVGSVPKNNTHIRSIGLALLYLAVDRCNEKETIAMGCLAVTFRGPFAFSIETLCVNVFAAKCDSHRAAIFTVNSEYPLCGRHRKGGGYVYFLKCDGIKNNLDPIEYISGNEDWILDTPAEKKVDPAQANFCLSVPRPKRIYAVSPASTEVVKGDPTGNFSDYATGLRFFYDCDLGKDIFLVTPEPKDLPLSLKNLPSLPVYGDLDVRYVGPEADDAEHLDAISCFDQTMKLVNLDWWLNYGQANSGALTRTGADCKSLAVVVGRSAQLFGRSFR